MFVSINIYFRPYEFLFLSLSIFGNIGSILYIKKHHFSMVKIVSVSLPIFTSENVPKNDFEITSYQSAQSCVNGVCTLQNTNRVFEVAILVHESSKAAYITHSQCTFAKIIIH